MLLVAGPRLPAIAANGVSLASKRCRSSPRLRCPQPVARSRAHRPPRPGIRFDHTTSAPRPDGAHTPSAISQGRRLPEFGQAPSNRRADSRPAAAPLPRKCGLHETHAASSTGDIRSQHFGRYVGARGHEAEVIDVPARHRILGLVGDKSELVPIDIELCQRRKWTSPGSVDTRGSPVLVSI
jgi:hypothetical protein